MSNKPEEIENAKHKSFQEYMLSGECTSFTQHVYGAGWDAAIGFLQSSYRQTLTAFMVNETMFVHVDRTARNADDLHGWEPLYKHEIKITEGIPESNGERELLQGIVNIIYSLNKNAHISHLDNVACDVLELINKTYQSRADKKLVGYAVPDHAEIMKVRNGTLITPNKTDLHDIPVYTCTSQVNKEAQYFRYMVKHMPTNLILDFFGNGCSKHIEDVIEELDMRIDFAKSEGEEI